MSASPLDPREDSESVDPKALDPADVAFHKARESDKKLPAIERMNSRAWLIDHGVIPDPKGKPKARKKESAPLSQGKTLDEVIYPFRGKRLALGEPRNLDAEVTLIACLVERPELLDELVTLDAEDFAGDAHRLIVTSIVARHRKGLSIDLVTLGAELDREYLFKETGGPEILANLASKATRNASAKELWDLVRGCAIKRRIIATARELERRAIESEDGDDALSQATALISSFHQGSRDASWERPLLNEGDSPLRFPVEVLPDGLKRFVESSAEVVYIPHDYLALPCLTIAGAGMGRSVGIRIKDTWVEFAQLFSMVVGNPGTSKTTAIVKLAPLPIKSILKDLRAEHSYRLAAWREAKQAAAVDRKAKGAPAVDYDEFKPRPRRILVEDVTRERLAEVLSENPRGTVMVLDEGSDWIEGMGQYKSGGGNDKQIYLKIFSFSPLTIDRKGHEDGVPITVATPFNAICSGVQPDYLPRMAMGGVDDGFIDRFLFAYPEEVKQDWSLKSIDPDAVKQWNAAFLRLWNRKNPMEPHEEPYVAPFAKKALQRYGEWFSAECKSVDAEDFPAYLKGPWSKLRVYAARLALLLEQLHWAYGDKSELKPGPVGLEALEGALSLIEYFKSHFIRVYSKIHGGKSAENDFAAEILAWCAKKKLTAFRESEARDNFRRRLVPPNKPQDLNVALNWLVSRRCIRRAPAPPRSGPGRTPAAVYEVNPHLSLESAR